MQGRRQCVIKAAAVVALMLAACSETKPRSRPFLTIRGALDILPSIRNEGELVAKFGPPHEVDIFDPSRRTPSSWIINWIPRERWSISEIFVPPTLAETLPVSTKLLIYYFENRNLYPATGGGLVVYVDEARILGWSFDVAFASKTIANGAVLKDYP